jgi:hypothetical protein
VLDISGPCCSPAPQPSHQQRVPAFQLPRRASSDKRDVTNRFRLRAQDLAQTIFPESAATSLADAATF